MEAVVIMTVLALIQYIYFGFRVGGSRERCGVPAPASSGNHEFECLHRVHMNTLELLVVLIPSLWLFAHYVNPLWGAGFTAVYLAGRFIYSAAYIKDPKNRSVGFLMSFLPIIVMAVWVLVVALMSYF